MPRFFTKDKDGNEILLIAIDPKTRVITYRADKKLIEEQTKMNTQRIAQAASDLANINLYSLVFKYGEVGQR